MLPLSVSGDLRDVDPAWLIRSLSRSHETGRLVVSDGEITRTLFFKNGDVIFATSSDPDDGLGAWLVREAGVSLATLEAVSAEVSADRRLGAVLIDQGRLSPEELVEAVSSQILEIIYAVVLAGRGRYRFDFTDPALREMIVLRRDPRAVLLAALRRVRSVSRVRRGLRALEQRRFVPAPPETWSSLDLGSDEERVLKLLPTPWDGSVLPVASDLGAWPVARSVWALSVVGLLVPVSAHLPPPLDPGARAEVAALEHGEGETGAVTGEGDDPEGPAGVPGGSPQGA